VSVARDDRRPNLPGGADDMRWMAAVAVVALATGCASVGGRGARIRELTRDGAADCKFLGTVEATDRSGWNMGDSDLGAVSEIRKRVAEKGGNAYALTHGTAKAYGAVVQADVYRCP
jgi:hypothetical protein